MLIVRCAFHRRWCAFTYHIQSKATSFLCHRNSRRRMCAMLSREKKIWWVRFKSVTIVYEILHLNRIQFVRTEKLSAHSQALSSAHRHTLFAFSIFSRRNEFPQKPNRLGELIKYGSRHKFHVNSSTDTTNMKSQHALHAKEIIQLPLARLSLFMADSLWKQATVSAHQTKKERGKEKCMRKNLLDCAECD